MSAPDPQPTSQQIDCMTFRLRVHEYIDDEMTAQDCEQLRIHLAQCQECVAEYERDVLLKALVRRSCGSEQAPMTLRRQIIASITTVRIEPRSDGSVEGRIEHRFEGFVDGQM